MDTSHRQRFFWCHSIDEERLIYSKLVSDQRFEALIGSFLRDKTLSPQELAYELQSLAESLKKEGDL